MPSGAVTVGSLVINMSANTGQLKADLADASASVKSSSQDMVNAWAGVAAESENATNAGERLVAQLKNEIATFGMTSQELIQYKANLNGVGAEVQALQARLEQMKSSQASFSDQRAASDAAAAARIREMVAASMAEVAATNEVAAATTGSAGAQAAATAVSRNFAEAQRLQALNMAGVAAAMRSAQEGTVALSTETQRILARFDPLGTKLRSLQAEFATLRKEMGNSVDPAAMKAFQGLEDEIAKTQALMAKAGTEGFDAVEKGAKKGAFATAGATRELIILGHEAMSGNFSRMPGSFMVLAERMSFLHTLISPTTLAFLGLGAAAIAVAEAMARGHEQLVAMDNALLVTSNYAGMSRQSMDQLANSMTQTKEVTIGTANAIVLALVASGRVGGEAIGQIAHFISDFAKSTGQSVDEIAPKMIALFTDPIRGAQELNSTMHFLTTAQMEHIAALERTGQVQAAQAELAKAASDHMPKQAENIGYVTKALLDQRDAWTKVGQAMLNWGKAPDKSAGAQAQIVRDEISELLAKGFTRKSPEVAYWQRVLDAMEPALNKQKEMTEAEKATAAANELQAKSWEAVKTASAAYHVQELQDRLTLIKAHKSEAGPDFAAQEAAKRDAIRKTNEEIDAAQRSMVSADRQLSEQQLANALALQEVKIKSAEDDITTAYKLGKISKSEFDQRMLMQQLSENDAKQDYERAVLRVAGLSDLERQSHQQKLALLKAQREAAEFKGVNAQNVDDAAIIRASDDAMNKYLSTLDSEAKKLEDANGARERSRSAIERETVARLDSVIAYQQQFMQEQSHSGATDAEIAQGKVVLKYLEDLRAARQRLAAGYAQQESDIFNQRAAEQAIHDWQRAGNSIADSLTHAFGQGGKAIGHMFKAYADGMAGQLKAQKDLAAAKKLSDDNPEKVEAINRAHLAGTQAQLKSYGDMADAAQSFFDQGSKGYQAMAAASKVMHAAEVALSLVKGVNAVLTQGEGDPYTAFGRMAAMTALVAGLGVALSGGSGGGMSAADRQKAQGTGSVLGDSTAKSESIARSVALAAANSSTQINYLAAMEASLRNIESGIGSFAAQLVKTSGITGATAPDYKSFSGKGVALAGAIDWGVGGAMIGSMFGPIGAILGGVLGAALGHSFVGKFLGSVFGGSKSVTDTGFTMGKGALGSVLANGANAQQYTDIKTDGGWFSSDKHNTDFNSLGADANAQFTTVLKSLFLGITEAAKLLGVSGDAFSQHLSQFVVDIGKVSLKGLSGDEIQKQLEAVFSKLGDDMAKFAIGGLGQFQKVGEGYLETLTRVATDYAKLDASLTSIGMTFGATGVASIKAREHLIDLAGGIDKLQSQTASFAQNFLTKGEQLAPVAKYVNDQMAALGLSGITTRDAFKQVVQGLDLSTESGQKEYASLMALQDAFAATHAATVDLTKTEQEIADERKGLQDQLDQLTMTQDQLLAKQRNALDASNRALFDQVQAAQKAKAAQDAAKTSLGNLVTQMGSFRDSTKSLHDSLLTGSLSTLTPEQQYAELRRQYEKTKTAALGGDATAQNNVAAALNAFLTFSQKINGADAQYQADFAMAQQDSASMSVWAANQVDVAQAQLNAMDSQNAALDAANATLAAIQQGIDNLPAALSNTPINPANYGNADAFAVLSAQFKALVATNNDLKAEIAGLRADQQRQTGDSISKNAQSQQNAADTIVGGLGGMIRHVVATIKQAELE